MHHPQTSHGFPRPELVHFLLRTEHALSPSLVLVESLERTLPLVVHVQYSPLVRVAETNGNGTAQDKESTSVNTGSLGVQNRTNCTRVCGCGDNRHMRRHTCLECLSPRAHGGGFTTTDDGSRNSAGQREETNRASQNSTPKDEERRCGHCPRSTSRRASLPVHAQQEAFELRTKYTWRTSTNVSCGVAAPHLMLTSSIEPALMKVSVM